MSWITVSIIGLGKVLKSVVMIEFDDSRILSQSFELIGFGRSTAKQKYLKEYFFPFNLIIIVTLYGGILIKYFRVAALREPREVDNFAVIWSKFKYNNQPLYLSF